MHLASDHARAKPLNEMEQEAPEEVTVDDPMDTASMEVAMDKAVADVMQLQMI